MMRTQVLVSVALTAALSVVACSQPAEPSAPARPQPPEAKATGRSAALPSAAAAVDAAGAPPMNPEPAAGEQGGTDQWRQVASAEDENRMARLGAAWRQALREADREHGAQIDALGMLLVPDAALPGRLQPPPGAYRCRTVKVGSMGGGGLSFVDYPWFKCSIELTPGGDLILTKTTGSQRTRGLLYPDPENDKRLVFIGAQAWGDDEKGFPAYGQIPARDQIGALERIGETRWRLALPWPKQESKLDVMELAK